MAIALALLAAMLAVLALGTDLVATFLLAVHLRLSVAPPRLITGLGVGMLHDDSLHLGQLPGLPGGARDLKAVLEDEGRHLDLRSHHSVQPSSHGLALAGHRVSAHDFAIRPLSSLLRRPRQVCVPSAPLQHGLRDVVGIDAIKDHTRQPMSHRIEGPGPCASLDHAVVGDLVRLPDSGDAMKPLFASLPVAGLSARMQHRVEAHDVGIDVAGGHLIDPALRPVDISDLRARVDQGAERDRVGDATTILLHALEPELRSRDVPRPRASVDEAVVGLRVGLKPRGHHVRNPPFCFRRDARLCASIDHAVEDHSIWFNARLLHVPEPHLGLVHIAGLRQRVNDRSEGDYARQEAVLAHAHQPDFRLAGIAGLCTSLDHRVVGDAIGSAVRLLHLSHPTGCHRHVADAREGIDNGVERHNVRAQVVAGHLFNAPSSRCRVVCLGARVNDGVVHGLVGPYLVLVLHASFHHQTCSLVVARQEELENRGHACVGC
mmetsp:Transcript_80383/g.260543  ORF Transcript_80383/g.260543 Transcript_80383/m.260543 type:complete len:490 (-) Transcript_80383:112-1581(-)